MTGPPAATAAVRRAVRAHLPAGPVAAAVSGGADSLALAAALAHERPGAYALVVDHALQPGSAAVAERAAGQCRALGLCAEVLTASGPGAGPGGPEARARSARYALLGAAAERLQLAAVLLGHTLEDQAETVLLGLARGSGARALAGMAPVRGVYRRPLLALDRATVRAGCDQAGLTPWEDPHNADEAYARVRVRRTALPGLQDALGPGIAPALARSAGRLREDADFLDALTPDLAVTPDCQDLAALPPALRSRALKRWAERESGRPVTSAHVEALRALVERWHGQGSVALPGGTRVERTQGRLACRRD